MIPNEAEFGKRLKTLLEVKEWTPDTERAFQRFKQRRVAKRRWVTVLALATLGLFAFGPTRAFTQKCVEACVAVLRPGPGTADFDLAAWKGSIVVVNYWATWCPPCLEEMPWLSELAARYAAQGVKVVGVSVDERGWEAVRPYLAAHPITYPVVLDSPKVREGVGAGNAIPLTVILDRDGEAVYRQAGRAKKEDLETQIERLLGASKQM
jgi:thiol-disulfide isomerase/thioredoxin